MIPVTVQFTSPDTIRVFKRAADGKPIGKGVLVRTAHNFAGMARDALAKLVTDVLLGNWRVVVWLRGGRLK